LRRQGVELIIVHDRWGMRNASRSRNIWAAVSRGSVLCFIDDDAEFDFEQLKQRILHVSDACGVECYWSDAPHILIVRSDVFFRVGGYDERHPIRGAEAVEIRERLRHMGVSVNLLDIRLVHLRDTWDRRHYLAANKSFTWTYIEYGTFPLRRVLLRKHPIKLARIWFWALQWILFTRWKRRSIFG
jgi:glycosyltransferase involved in cell wall biosynthesis